MGATGSQTGTTSATTGAAPAGGLTGGQAAGLVGISAISQFGSIYSSITSQQIEGDFRQRQLETNQKMAEMQASDAIERGEKDAARLRARTKKLIGTQRTALAAQGIDIESGSAADVLEDTAASSAVDELTIRNNAAREAFGYRAQALSFGAQAGFAGISRDFGVQTTLATGGLSFARDITSLAAQGAFAGRRGFQRPGEKK